MSNVVSDKLSYKLIVKCTRQFQVARGRIDKYKKEYERGRQDGGT